MGNLTNQDFFSHFSISNTDQPVATLKKLATSEDRFRKWIWNGTFVRIKTPRDDFHEINVP